MEDSCRTALSPVLTGAVAATGFYFGAELVTVAAAESAAPEEAVAHATQTVISRVLVFYVGSILVVVTLLPWNSPEMAQPYVSALRQLRVPGAAEIMRGVILTAVLSALNSGLFGSSRMLMALSPPRRCAAGIVLVERPGSADPPRS